MYRNGPPAYFILPADTAFVELNETSIVIWLSIALGSILLPRHKVGYGLVIGKLQINVVHQTPDTKLSDLFLQMAQFADHKC
jgi:hypothetical protein